MFEAWNLPQWIVATWLIVTLLINAHRHGTPRTGHYNTFHAMFDLSFVAFVLYMGGFWS